MKCPRCGSEVKKARLDVYWCEKCKAAYLIHRLHYKSYIEASAIRG